MKLMNGCDILGFFLLNSRYLYSDIRYAGTFSRYADVEDNILI